MTAETVRVWLIGPRLPAHVHAYFETVLDDEERQRANGLLFERDRRRFVAAHGAARTILGRQLGVPPERIRWVRGPHGKPELAGAASGPRVNISHSGDVAMVAVSARRPVGVDIQRLPADLDAVRMSARYFTGPEASFVAAATDPAARVTRFACLWARKEACVKAAGGRLMQGMALPVLCHPPSPPARSGPSAPAGILVRGDGGALPGPYLVRDITAPRGFRAAVALEGAQSYQVIQHRWRGWA